MAIESRLKELGITLPETARPVGSYIPAVQWGGLVLTSGQLPLWGGELIAQGKVPTDVSVEDAQRAAKIAAINGLAAIVSVVKELDRIEGILRVAVFVNSGVGFTDQAKVANGASDFLVELFGDAGRHVRAAVGVSELPLNAAVELELTARVRS